MSDYWAGECVVNERLAKHRAAVLRPILELEKRGEPISTAIGDAAWELGLAKSHTWSLYRRLRENDARATALELDRRGPKRGSQKPCCTDQRRLGTRPTRDGFQAVRSKCGRPSSVIRFSTRTPILASVFWFSNARAFSLGPMIPFQRPMRVSPRLR